ncbi:MAG: Holliday junction branch migration protein RuvA [Armatimonadetes bacterium]|nr:Holliday junction branch migration protein RuvA [Armatimonadota bacterium]
MIAHLRGTLLFSGPQTAIIEAGGVGYEIAMPESALAHLPPNGGEASCFVRQVFREDGVYLFGFSTLVERNVFDLLTEVKGCGPKTGLAILSTVGVEATLAAIMSEDRNSLTKASGVGPRLADRIILELKDKVTKGGASIPIMDTGALSTKRLNSTDEVVEALINLGYKRAEAETAVSKVDSSVSGVEAKIVAALRGLQK